jgi:surface antigen
MNRRTLLALPVLLALSGCTRDEHWHQRLTLIVETPDGPRSASVVQRIDWQGATGLYKSATAGLDPSQTSTRVTGEALALEVAPGRWVFALLKGDTGWQGEPGLNAGYVIAVPKGHPARSAEGVEDILAYPKDRPLVLPPEAWPMLVTFDDITDPTSVRRIDPTDLAASFGVGFALKAMTLEVTEEAVTERGVEGVLGWLRPLWPNMLDGQRYETIEAENRFANSINVGHFSSELGK